MDDPGKDKRLLNLDPIRKREYDGYFEAYNGPLCGYARSILWEKFRGWEDAAYDCAQDALLKLAHALAEGLNPFASDERNEAHVKNWLYYVTKNRAREELREVGRHPQTGLDKLSGRVEVDEDMLLSNILSKELLEELLAQLGPQERVVFQHGSEGFSNEEIADYLHTTPGYVKQLKSKAARRLRECRRDFDV